MRKIHQIIIHCKFVANSKCRYKKCRWFKVSNMIQSFLSIINGNRISDRCMVRIFIIVRARRPEWQCDDIQRSPWIVSILKRQLRWMSNPAWSWLACGRQPQCYIVQWWQIKVAFERRLCLSTNVNYFIISKSSIENTRTFQWRGW